MESSFDLVGLVGLQAVSSLVVLEDDCVGVQLEVVQYSVHRLSTTLISVRNTYTSRAFTLNNFFQAVAPVIHRAGFQETGVFSGNSVSGDIT